MTEDIFDFAPSDRSESYFGLLMQLDSISEPGVTEEVFRDLFSRCRTCRKYMTRRMTAFHHCEGTGETMGTGVDVIDLTQEA